MLRGLIVLALVAALAGAPGVAAKPPHFLGPTLKHPSTPPDFALRDQHGRLVRLAQEHGKVVLITFLYTHCPDLCPLTAQNLNGVLTSLGAKRRNIVVLAVSVDPKGDTPAAVDTFVRNHRLLPQFHYLAGTRSELQPIWNAYNVTPLRAGGPDPDHTLYILAVDRGGMARILFDALAKQPTILHDVRLLLAAPTS